MYKRKKIAYIFLSGIWISQFPISAPLYHTGQTISTTVVCLADLPHSPLPIITTLPRRNLLRHVLFISNVYLQLVKEDHKNVSTCQLSKRY